MKLRKIFLVLPAVLLVIAVRAQHCPFDGGSLVAVKLTDSKGVMINPNKYTVTLKEINNNVADSCTYAPGLLDMRLYNSKDFVTFCKDYYRPYYGDKLIKRLQQKGITGNSNLFIILNQAQTECMLKDNNDFNYRTREFVVRLTWGGKTIEVPVPEDAVYSLCTNNDAELNNFKPVVLPLH